MRHLLLTLFTIVQVAGADDIGPLQLLPEARVNSEGILLSDVVTNKSGEPLPRINLSPAPAIGRPLVLTRYQVNDLLVKTAPELVCSNWSGPDRIKIVRATRVVDEQTLRDLLTSTLQNEHVKTRGDLELRFTRPWTSVLAPDEVLSLKILELPTSGVSPHFICRFEIIAGDEAVGSFQQSLQASIWREIYVARSNLQRGQALKDADIAMEKRDILKTRDYLTEVTLDDPYIEFRENVQAGTPVTARMLRLRAIVKRGKLVDAMVQDAGMIISVKAEALEDGVPGQPIRLRNLRSKRQITGKVQDEQTVTVIF